MCHLLLSLTWYGLQNSYFPRQETIRCYRQNLSTFQSFSENWNMIRSEAVTNSSENATGLSRIVPSYAEGIALCTAFILTLVFIVVGNLLTIVLFAINRKLRRKKSLFLVINMACADLMLGIVTLPIYIYSVCLEYGFWTGGPPMSLSIFYMAVNSIFTFASLNSAAFISSERFYAMQWPLNHLTLSMGAYRHSYSPVPPP